MTAPKRDQGTSDDPFADLRDFDREHREHFAHGSEKREPVAAEATRKAEQKYAHVLEISAALTSTLDLTELLNHIIDGIIEVTECGRGFLMLREEDGTFSSHIGRTADRGTWEIDEGQVSSTIVRKVAETGEPFIEPNLDDVRGLKKSGSIHEQSIRSAICLPLKFKDELKGVIYADSNFTVPQVLESDHSLLNAFAAQAAIAIENARRHGELKTDREQLEEQNLSLRHELAKEFTFAGMVSKNKQMREVFEIVERIAPREHTVLVRGESGTGKELMARAIHEKSPRNKGPFLTVNSAGLNAELVESILFGHKRGSFTGAIQDKPGVFELADGGTLFLDEIGDMPLNLQPRILRVLQEKEFHRLGEEDRVRMTNVRILAATNVDLPRAVESGAFREDLFFRLNSAQVMLPPLRDRREDIVPLAEHFIKKYADDENKPIAVLSRDARQYLKNYRWPGNVRELKSAIEWAFEFQDDSRVIRARVFQRYFLQGGTGVAMNTTEPAGSLRDQMAVHEEKLIRRTLESSDYNITSAAKMLEISRQQLHNKIRKFGIKKKD